MCCKREYITRRYSQGECLNKSCLRIAWRLKGKRKTTVNSTSSHLHIGVIRSPVHCVYCVTGASGSLALTSSYLDLSVDVLLSLAGTDNFQSTLTRPMHRYRTPKCCKQATANIRSSALLKIESVFSFVATICVKNIVRARVCLLYDPFGSPGSLSVFGWRQPGKNVLLVNNIVSMRRTQVSWTKDLCCSANLPVPSRYPFTWIRFI